MHISNDMFLKTLNTHETDNNELIGLFEKSVKLFLIYGNKLISKEYLSKIKETNVSLGNFLYILHKYGKLSIKDMKYMISLIKKRSNYTRYFNIKTNKNIDTEDINTILKEKFEECNVNSKLDSQIGFVIKGDGFSYKRLLSSDLDKLLS